MLQAPAPTSALVLFSGGQDSTVSLAWALTHYSHVETIGFDYGQRHGVELQQRVKIRDAIAVEFPAWGQRLGADHVLTLDTFGQISDTAMTRAVTIQANADGLPNTFVPGRNLLFFVYAASVAYRRGIATLVGGMCETDYSGYPDCRNATLQSLATSLSLGLDRQLLIETPLMYIDKAGTFAMAHTLGGRALAELVIELSHTCYLGDRTHRHAWGYGCGTCPACGLRSAGWQRYTDEAQALR
jgi:7-cyano-7-deazaguanine synthase